MMTVWHRPPSSAPAVGAAEGGAGLLPPPPYPAATASAVPMTTTTTHPQPNTIFKAAAMAGRDFNHHQKKASSSSGIYGDMKASSGPTMAGKGAGTNQRPTVPSKSLATEAADQHWARIRADVIAHVGVASKTGKKPGGDGEADGGADAHAAAPLPTAVLDKDVLRGITMRPSGKWQAQIYFLGKSRYIGVFHTREEAALAYELVRGSVKPGPGAASAT